MSGERLYDSEASGPKRVLGTEGLGAERVEACIDVWMSSSSEVLKSRSTRRNVTSGVRLMSNPAGGLSCLTRGDEGLTVDHLEIG